MIKNHFITSEASDKESICQCRRTKGCRFYPWVERFPWRRKWQPTPLFLLGKPHGQRSLEGYSPWGHRELDTTKVIQHPAYLQTEAFRSFFIKVLENTFMCFFFYLLKQIFKLKNLNKSVFTVSKDRGKHKITKEQDTLTQEIFNYFRL